MNRTASRIVGACVCFALLASLVASPAAAQSDEGSLLVEVDAEGDAVVSVTFAYDLDGADEEAAFEELRENASARAETAQRFENRLAAVAADASTATDREMSVRDASVELQWDGDVGIVTLSIEWSNLAAVDGDRLTMTEPFVSGFEPEERTFTVTTPDGYAIVSATPEPDRAEETSVSWNGDTSLENFEIVIEAAAEGTDGEAEGTTEEMPDEDTTEDSPGFGVGVAALALLSTALLAVRRRG